MTKINIVAALDVERGYANDAGIPWNLPFDKQYYQSLIGRDAVLMGAGTYDSHETPLSNQPNFVLTHRTEPLRPGFEKVRNIDEVARYSGIVWAIGGNAVFNAALPHAEELHLTAVQEDFECTKFFPPFAHMFNMVAHWPDHTENGVTYNFTRWQSRTKLGVYNNVHQM
jgi:dihydrofolate reductase